MRRRAVLPVRELPEVVHLEDALGADRLADHAHGAAAPPLADAHAHLPDGRWPEGVRPRERFVMSEPLAMRDDHLLAYHLLELLRRP